MVGAPGCCKGGGERQEGQNRRAGLHLASTLASHPTSTPLLGSPLSWCTYKLLLEGSSALCAAGRCSNGQGSQANLTPRAAKQANLTPAAQCALHTAQSSPGGATLPQATGWPATAPQLNVTAAAAAAAASGRASSNDY